MEIINYTVNSSYDSFGAASRPKRRFLPTLPLPKKTRARAKKISPTPLDKLDDLSALRDPLKKIAQKSSSNFFTNKKNKKSRAKSHRYTFDAFTKTDKTRSKTFDKSIDKTRDRTFNSAFDITLDKTHDRTSDRTFDRAFDKAFNKNTFGNALNKSSDKTLDNTVAKRVLRLAIFAASCTVILFSFLYSNKRWGWTALVSNPFENFAEPALISPAIESEEATLRRVMDAFAIENNPLHDDEGFLQNSDTTSPKPFCDAVTLTTYTVRSGDTIESITRDAGLKNISTIIAINDIDNVRLLRAGQKLRVPNIDGLFYTSEGEETLSVVAQKFGVKLEALADVNDKAQDAVAKGEQLFIPGAKLSKSALQDALGQSFISPLSSYRLTSHFGSRIDPISGVRSNHTGIDMAAPMGTKIKSSGTGTISYAGTSPVFGNYVIINHSGGVQTLYGHMSKILAKKGQWVAQGSIIGLVGSTGYSTGPHLHFTVYKNGKLVDPYSIIGK